jgi:uncharacterized protein YpuA (DUF1002 family)
MKRITAILLTLAVLVGFSGIQSVKAADNETESINEKFGLPIVVYGETLTAEQKQEVQKLLDVKDTSQVEEIIATGEDLANYIEGEDRNARMFSSAKITRKEKGEGLKVDIVTPANITEVTNSMYANALLTAGIENATVQVASPIKVSGHSALVGIYKAYDEGGEKLDTVRMEVANEELNVATELAKEEGMNQEKVSELLTEIKKEMADQNPATKEEVEKIVEEKLKSLNIELSPEDRQLLIDLFEKMRSINIDFDNVKQQLEDLTTEIQSTIKDLVKDEGFGEKVSNFFSSIIQAISDFFTSVANFFKNLI